MFRSPFDEPAKNPVLKPVKGKIYWTVTFLRDGQPTYAGMFSTRPEAERWMEEVKNMPYGKDTKTDYKVARFSYPVGFRKYREGTNPANDEQTVHSTTEIYELVKAGKVVFISLNKGYDIYDRFQDEWIPYNANAFTMSNDHVKDLTIQTDGSLIFTGFFRREMVTKGAPIGIIRTGMDEFGTYDIVSVKMRITPDEIYDGIVIEKKPSSNPAYVIVGKDINTGETDYLSQPASKKELTQLIEHIKMYGGKAPHHINLRVVPYSKKNPNRKNDYYIGNSSKGGWIRDVYFAPTTKVGVYNVYTVEDKLYPMKSITASKLARLILINREFVRPRSWVRWAMVQEQIYFANSNPKKSIS